MSVLLCSNDPNDLPSHSNEDSKTKEDKPFRIPRGFTVTQILEHLFKDLNMKKFIVTTSADREDACAYLQLLIMTNIKAPEDDQPQMIVLDNQITTQTIKNELWDVIHPGAEANA